MHLADAQVLVTKGSPKFPVLLSQGVAGVAEWPSLALTLVPWFAQCWWLGIVDYDAILGKAQVGLEVFPGQLGTMGCYR